MYTKNAKKKIENMPLQERIAYGYKKVIMLMLISGLLSIIAIGVLLAGSFELCAENQCFRHSSENVQSECKCCCKKYKGNGVG